MERLSTYTAQLAAQAKGIQFTRLAKFVAQAGQKGPLHASTLAAAYPDVRNVLRAGIDSTMLELVLRGAVDPGTTSDSGFASALAQYTQLATEFAALLRPLTIVGRLAGLRRVPFLVSYPRQTSGTVVSWVGQGQPAPVGEVSLESVHLGFSKASGIVVVTSELAKSSKPQAEALLRNELLAGMVQFLDAQFITPSVVAVADTSPASITNGIIAVQSSGSTATAIASDLATMVSTMADADVPFLAPAWIMRPADAAKLAAKRDTAGGPAFPDIRVNGGTLLGIPVLTSNGVPSSVSGGSIVVLVDASLIDVADEGLLAVDSADQATLEMSTTPSAGAQQRISLFQSNLRALRVTAFANWARRDDNAVAVLDNVHW